MTRARTVDADAVLVAEHRRVMGAHQDLAVVGRKFARLEIERLRKVRAAIDVRPDVLAAPEEDYAARRTVGLLLLEGARASVGNRIERDVH